jgi:hypothetical protein
MSEIVHLYSSGTCGRAPAYQGRKQRRAALVALFAEERRAPEDVFWLKENAEILNILECTGAGPCPEILQPLQDTYSRLPEQLRFFPQYYRFLLSICLDLEDLGFDGGQGEAMARWVRRSGLAEAELSDLQRAEAERLLARRGQGSGIGGALRERLIRFISRTGTFALPNKKAAYELTHIVFYLSEYGRRNPGIGDAAVTSLEYAGILALLEQNSDLLAEVCLALRYAGRCPPAAWEDWLERQAHQFVLQPGPAEGDQYHDFLVCNWLMAAAGRQSFVQPVPAGAVSVVRRAPQPGILGAVSRQLFQLGVRRSGDWAQMRREIEPALDEQGQRLLDAAAASPSFEAFFAGFARAGEAA